jgi:hypothetical protein
VSVKVVETLVLAIVAKANATMHSNHSNEEPSARCWLRLQAVLACCSLYLISCAMLQTVPGCRSRRSPLVGPMQRQLSFLTVCCYLPAVAESTKFQWSCQVSHVPGESLILAAGMTLLKVLAAVTRIQTGMKGTCTIDMW